jgi:hypothetical protein
MRQRNVHPNCISCTGVVSAVSRGVAPFAPPTHQRPTKPPMGQCSDSVGRCRHDGQRRIGEGHITMHVMSVQRWNGNREMDGRFGHRKCPESDTGVCGSPSIAWDDIEVSENVYWRLSEKKYCYGKIWPLRQNLCFPKHFTNSNHHSCYVTGNLFRKKELFHRKSMFCNKSAEKKFLPQIVLAPGET